MTPLFWAAALLYAVATVLYLVLPGLREAESMTGVMDLPGAEMGS